MRGGLANSVVTGVRQSGASGYLNGATGRQSMAQIQDLLWAWSKGKAIDDAPNRLPSASAFAKLLGRGNVGPLPLGHDEHLAVDKVVSDMKNRKKAHHYIIVEFYLNHKTDVQIGRQMKPERWSRSKVRETRIAAEHYLEAKLESVVDWC